MPISKRRKRKNGKKVGNGTNVVVDPNKESSVTLQDLINVLAWQESQKDDDDPTKMKRPDNTVPVVHYDEDGHRHVIGSAEVSEDHESGEIRITNGQLDANAAEFRPELVADVVKHLSIDKMEDEDER